MSLFFSSLQSMYLYSRSSVSFLDGSHDASAVDVPDQAPDQHNSLTHVDPIRDMYNLPDPRIPENLSLPFRMVDGEAVCHHGRSVDGLVVLTNFRVYLEVGDSRHHICLGLIESVEHKELFFLHIWCKDARTYRCTFSNNENCLLWFERLTRATERTTIAQIFAFYHFIWTKETQGENFARKFNHTKSYTFDHALFRGEMERLRFQGDSWRISEANRNYKLCPTYPPYLIVPSCINDETLEAVAKFRSSRRIPAVVWRHVKNGAVIARCSQPEVGWLGWRSSDDEDLIKAISQACSFDPRNDKESLTSHSPGSLHSEDSLQITEMNTKEKKVLIMDARSYTTAVANRARGGGVECPEYYPNCDITFMNLANIHSIRKSFNAMRVLCTGTADAANWFSQLESTRWLLNMSGLMKAAVVLVNAVEREARPVLVHCSDGWDRTPQIVALAELLLDPYYRTRDGFRILVEREWLAFGHKFADRCGHAASLDANELCPVFLQWLDCVHQLLAQFKCSFEFSQGYLVKLAQHVYSNIYGTFLCNTFQERMRQVTNETFPVWEFLSTINFRNHLYDPLLNAGNPVIWPRCNIRDLRLWHEVYLGSWEYNPGTESGSGSCPGPPESSPSHMTKTRSYGDLINAADACAPPPAHFRRSSDPSINIDKKLVISQENNCNGGAQQPQDMVNGHASTSTDQELPSGVDFLSNENDDVECKPDCMFKDDNSVAAAAAEEEEDDDDDEDEERPSFQTLRVDDNSVIRENGRDGGCSSDRVVINGDKTDREEVDDEDVLCDVVVKSKSCASEDLTPSSSNTHCYEADSDNELTERSESKSETTVCDVGATERLETSTDTLVSDSHNISSSPLEMNGFEKLQRPVEDVDAPDGYKLSAQNLRLVHEASTSRRPDASNYVNINGNGSPMHSRTSSTSGWDNGLAQPRPWHHQGPHSHRLGDDGLVLVTSVAQERLWQIIQEHKRKEEQLEKELHTYRQALLKQSCHKCNNNDGEKTDDAGSVVESVCSAGEGQASAVESLRSDMSWEAVEDNCGETECTTLWVPDHAVSRCTGCQTEFWVGKRKHHCRKCGRIFCASCSENSTPLPSEQLYNPVRVCTGCFSKLRRDCAEIPDQCKHTNGQATSSNPQITASSN